MWRVRHLAGHLPCRRATPGAGERGDAKVEEDHHENGGGDEGAVIGAVQPTGAGLPKLWCKDDYGQQEEDPANFKPDDAADAAKGAEKSAHSAGHTAARLRGDAAGRLARCSGRGRTRRRGVAGDVLSRDAARNAEPDAERPPDGLWSHSVYDGNSDPLSGASAQLPITRFRLHTSGIGIKVEGLPGAR